ncbi:MULTISPECIES: magnesium and cobalt transport protein CorA [unclassified Frigoribacterium]|jgi:magnesium transporter|uniref:magnesium and cobalt transport protein CorA n=1 Tax=unclassified Frigoribacterium TaxID=2627005 RepID=UPI0007017D58|nr:MULTISPECIES: magnesium and cobalt transport protein CorA [unclassified Frigoribacterium]KQO84482.1 transporter [Frigoribacterium sp. Leaf263]KQR63804.1 transporter [Frigoribacterium sp. Leaf172]
MPLQINDVYVDGRLHVSPETLDDTYAALADTGGTAWVVLAEPDADELASLARQFDLHELAVEDAGSGHQRAKLERYGATLFVVVRPAVYLDDEETVAFGEIHGFVGENFFVGINHVAHIDARHVSRGVARLRSKPDLLGAGPQAMLWALLDAVVDAYKPVIDGLENDIDEIEQQLFAGEPGVSRRIYELFGEVADFQKASRPLIAMLDGLLRGSEKYRVGTELERRLRDVQDHVIRVVDRADTFRAVLQNALALNATLVAQDSNEVTKRISAWAAILFAPTLVGAVYGMNFDVMPELHWAWGYPFALGLMVAIAGGLFGAFRWKRWL